MLVINFNGFFFFFFITFVVEVEGGGIQGGEEFIGEV